MFNIDNISKKARKFHPTVSMQAMHRQQRGETFLQQWMCLKIKAHGRCSIRDYLNHVKRCIIIPGQKLFTRKEETTCQENMKYGTEEFEVKISNLSPLN